mgnify:CR=1 FL=1
MRERITGMRDGDRAHELGLEIRVHGRLNVRVLTRDLPGLEPRQPVQQRDPGAVTGGVADRHDPVQRTVRDQTQHHGMTRVDVTPKGSRQHDAIDGGHAAAANLNEAARRRALEYTYLMQRLMD